MRPNKIVKEGIARTFQNIRLFKKMSAIENVMTGFHCRTHADVLSIIFQPQKCAREKAEITQKAKELLDYIGMLDQKDELAGSLPYGHQRLLEIARALASQPKLLLLDEPAAGMNKVEKKELIDLITRIRKDFDMTVMLVEHDMDVIMTISDEVAVLNYGSLMAYGTPEEIQKMRRSLQPTWEVRIDMSVLEINNLVATYGPIVALRNVSMHVEKGELVSLVGANGAGKSTLLNSILGLVNIKEGEIILEGENVVGMPYYEIFKRGLPLFRRVEIYLQI